MASFIRRPGAAPAASSAPAVLPVCEFAERYPALLEFLSLTSWDDGAPRVPGSALLTHEDGVFKLWLNDRACDRTAWLSGLTVSILLESAESGILADSIGWRRAYKGQNGKRGR